MARPTKLPKMLEDGYWAEVGRGASRRTMRNCYFRWEAVRILCNHGIENFKYLFDESKEGTGVKYIRTTILSELGRIADDDLIVDIAKQLCNAKASTVDAVKYIRNVRKLTGSRNEVYTHNS